jgi:hypothetical protein
MSCLFDSLSKFLNGVPSSMLRMRICDFLSTNPLLMEDLKAEDVIKHETGMTLAVYVCNMRMPSTMGGAIEIKAFAKLFRVNVWVDSLPNKKVIEFIEDPQLSWCHLKWTGGHFDPVISF